MNDEYKLRIYNKMIYLDNRERQRQENLEKKRKEKKIWKRIY